MSRLVFPLVSLATACLGYVVGWQHSTKPAPDQPPVPLSSPRLASPPPESPAPDSNASGGILSERLDRLFSGITESAKLFDALPQLYRLAKSLKSEEFPAAIAAAQTSGKTQGTNIARLLENFWAESDLEAAKAWSLNRPGPFPSAEFLASWMRQRPEEATAWLEALPPAELEKFIQYQPNFVAAVAPKTAVHLLLAIHPPKIPQGVAFAKVEYDPDRSAFGSLFQIWATREPERAAQEALALPSGARKAYAVEGLLDGWARKNPGAARAWIETLQDEVLASKAISAYAITIAENDPRSAAGFIVQHPVTGASIVALERVAQLWAEINPDQALGWLPMIEDEIVRTRFSTAFLKRLTDIDPGRAAAVRQAQAQK